MRSGLRQAERAEIGIARVASYRVSLQSPGDVVGGTSHARAGSERQQRAEHGGDVPQ